MMNLDDLAAFETLDKQDMLGHINGLPDQLQTAWDLGQTFQLPDVDGVWQILVAGMGGSAIGADLIAAYAQPLCPLPLTVHRDYDLPAWASGPETLVIASSHSGNTEETVTAFEQAGQRGCRRMVITTGGKLMQMAGAGKEVPVWQFHHTGQPRAAVGFSFGLLLAVLSRTGLLPDPSADLAGTLDAMRRQQAGLLPDVPVVHNLAKREAGQLIGRWVAVFAADILNPVARRWKGQISEVAKAWGQFEFIPEADHNTLAGLNNPESALSQTIALFLTAPSNHPRNTLRMDYTRQIFMTQGINTDMFAAQGDNPMAHIWTMLHLGDYIAYYLAMAYQEDPTPVDALGMLKAQLSSAH